MRFMDVDKLNPHPKNNYFFDDIEGEAWTAFLESVETSGVIEPVIVDAVTLTIVSGHQRVRACRVLGIKQVLADERGFDSEDEMLKQLIEANIRQRGIGNINPVKFGRCIAELERIYGIRNGSAGKVAKDLDGHNVSPKTESDLAEQLEISTKQLGRYKSLADLIPELQDAVQSGQITATTAMGFVKKLSPEEQKKLAESISGQDKVSGKEVEKYVAEIRRLSEENKRLHDDNKILSRRAEPTVIEKTVEVEVVPDDYEQAKRDAEIAKRDFKASQKQYEEMAEKWKASEREREKLLKEKNDPDAKEAERIKLNAMSLVAGVSNFLEKFGGYSFLMSEINSHPKQQKDAVNEAVNAMNNWVSAMLNETVSEVIE